MADTGRGAWTTIGKDNGSIYYQYIKGEPRDGATPEKGLSYEAVHFGVKAIQSRLVDLGYDRFVRNGFDIDGKFGPKTKRMVKKYQENNGIYVSGAVGQTTGSHLFGTYIAEAAEPFRWDHSYIYGIMKAESAADPGAVGWFTPADRGLYQFNTLVHAMSFEQAHDYIYATDEVLSRFNNAWERYQGKGEELRINCSIAQHNAPAWADEWFETGKAPNETIKKYVGTIRSFAVSAP